MALHDEQSVGILQCGLHALLEHKDINTLQLLVAQQQGHKLDNLKEGRSGGHESKLGLENASIGENTDYDYNLHDATQDPYPEIKSAMVDGLHEKHVHRLEKKDANTGDIIFNLYKSSFT